jgi:hypothetical protein
MKDQDTADEDAFLPEDDAESLQVLDLAASLW